LLPWHDPERFQDSLGRSFGYHTADNQVQRDDRGGK